MGSAVVAGSSANNAIAGWSESSYALASGTICWVHTDYYEDGDGDGDR